MGHLMDWSHSNALTEKHFKRDMEVLRVNHEARAAGPCARSAHATIQRPAATPVVDANACSGGRGPALAQALAQATIAGCAHATIFLRAC